MEDMKKVFFLFVASGVVQIVLPILYYFYLSSLMDYEYENGIRTSTGGDSIMIPVAGMFVLVFLTLVFINIIAACYFLWKKHKGVSEN